MSMSNNNSVNIMHQNKTDSVSDEVLIVEYAKGNVGAFEDLYRRHKTALFSFLRRQCLDAGIAEELTHDTWLAVIKQASSYQESATFKTWIYRIAHNRLVDYWRKHGRSSYVLLDEVNESINAQDRSSESLELAQLFAQLKNLSDEQTTTMLLKIEGFTYAEIAKITDAKQETVKSRLRYATAHLSGSMELTL